LIINITTGGNRKSIHYKLLFPIIGQFFVQPFFPTLSYSFKKLVSKMSSCLLPSLVFQKKSEHIPEQMTRNYRYIFRYDEAFRKLTLDQRGK
jgi:predicted Na+-dependent transporter